MKLKMLRFGEGQDFTDQKVVLVIVDFKDIF